MIRAFPFLFVRILSMYPGHKYLDIYYWFVFGHILNKIYFFRISGFSIRMMRETIDCVTRRPLKCNFQ